MDYKEEQANEIEALESIYYGDVEILSTEPFHKFSIPIKSEAYVAEEANGLTCNLIFAYTPKYPEEAPRIEVEAAVNFEDEFESELIRHLEEQVAENIGMVMIFTLVSSAQEWLNTKWDAHKKFADEEKARKQREDEEAELKRFEGTKVTVETFLKWKLKFEGEMGITKKREAIEKDGKKLTGKALFMTDQTLNESDLKFLDNGDAVKVDESLFQELDDLDLDDDDDDDFDPKNYHSDES